MNLDVVGLLAGGVACLHASAVSDGRRAVAFAGPRGAGKSTLAAALVDAGWVLVSDDILPVETATGLARPVPAPIRLVVDGDSKRERRVGMAMEPVRLDCLWLIDPDDCGRLEVRPLDGADAVVAIAAAMPSPAEDEELDESQRFEAAVALARRVRCARLRLPPVQDIELARLVER